MQVQLALLDVVWGLDELALPGCAASLGDLVCAQGFILLIADHETGWDAMGRRLPCYHTLQSMCKPAYRLAGVPHPFHRCQPCSTQLSPAVLPRASCCGGARGCAWAFTRGSPLGLSPTL